MRIRLGAWVAAFGLLAGISGCGGDAVGPTGPAREATQAAPTKDAVIGLLRDLLAALEAGDADRAVGLLVPFPGGGSEEGKAAVAALLERREISARGIDRLAAGGRYGSLKEVFPDRGETWARQAGVDPEKCVGLGLEGAEVAVHWGGDRLRLLRVDDVGKLE